MLDGDSEQGCGLQAAAQVERWFGLITQRAIR
jgi:hypothetical protein